MRKDWRGCSSFSETISFSFGKGYEEFLADVLNCWRNSIRFSSYHFSAMSILKRFQKSCCHWVDCALFSWNITANLENYIRSQDAKASMKDCFKVSSVIRLSQRTASCPNTFLSQSSADLTIRSLKPPQQSAKSTLNLYPTSRCLKFWQRNFSSKVFKNFDWNSPIP